MNADKRLTFSPEADAKKLKGSQTLADGYTISVFSYLWQKSFDPETPNRMRSPRRISCCSDVGRFHSFCGFLSVTDSSPSLRTIFILTMPTRVSCLHFAQNSGYRTRTVSGVFLSAQKESMTLQATQKLFFHLIRTRSCTKSSRYDTRTPRNRTRRTGIPGLLRVSGSDRWEARLGSRLRQ